jgi:hypothetical protein
VSFNLNRGLVQADIPNILLNTLLYRPVKPFKPDIITVISAALEI